MSIVNIFRRASNLLSGDDKISDITDAFGDNEVLFCKNNVCIHPLASVRKQSELVHFPGYLTVTTKTFVDQFNEARRSTLLLTWIPNTSFCKSKFNENDMYNIRKRYEPAFSLNNSIQLCESTEEKEPQRAKSVEIDVSVDIQELKNELQPLLGDRVNSIPDINTLLNGSHITSVNITISNPHIENSNIKHSLNNVVTDMNKTCFKRDYYFSDEENLSHAASEIHSLQSRFNESSTATTLKNAFSRRFSVDLSHMRSLRLFFSDDNCTSGQLVIVSRESQYKILHFHYGGLDHLAQVLHQWHCFLHNITITPGQNQLNLPYRQFLVCRPEIKKCELHPDEGSVRKITTNFFYGTLINIKGQIEDDLLLRKCVFFGGLEKSLRKTIWPFILRCYSFTSTFDDRAVLMDIRKQEYDEITQKRLYSMSPEQQIHFWKSVQCVVEKDIARIDCTNTFFCGEDNPHREIMKNILLNYAVYNGGSSYSQGMSDLLVPLLCEIQNESETFWSFVGLLQRSFFVCAPTDTDIDRNLNYLRELIRIMLPRLYGHLNRHSSSMELLFCHRWLILCFKREFTETVVIRMWEACWSNYLTDYFHLFLCLAIIAVYADDVMAQDLRADEMLFYFSSLAMYMDGHLILRKARGLLYQYRQLSRIPCTLSGLCKRCGPGMWDSEHCPALECVGHSLEDKCSLDID